jgi:G3E family GTPase
MTDIYIVSGFLGAGKTTLIRKLLAEALRGEKTVIVENDFGEVGIDAALLRTSGAEVEEISAGCICCSLSGDLVKTLKKMLVRYKPDKLIIEPSGVGKLSDIAESCADEGLRGLAILRHKLTVVDAVRCRSYLENFGEFFADQIGYADTVLLSRTDDPKCDVDAARALVSELNACANIIVEPWSHVSATALLAPEGADEHSHSGHSHDGHSHDGHGAHDHCGDAHDDSADDVFDTVTVRTERIFSPDDLMARALRMDEYAEGTVLRAKGILRGTAGRLTLQYLPGDARVELCGGDGGDEGDSGDDAICVIGLGLNGPGLAALFDGVL